jgi:ceramide glucosyltransferase
MIQAAAAFTRVLSIVKIVLAGTCFTAIGFYLSSVLAAARLFGRRRPEELKSWPEVSILKPICGVDRESFENLASFCRQDYPRFEILFGALDPADPGLEVVRKIRRDFPKVRIRIVTGAEARGTNPKVNILAALARAAASPLLLVSDSDIRVAPDYLRSMVGRLYQDGVGMVTSLYSTRAEGGPGRLEGLGTATDFIPGVIVAREFEGVRFGLGAGILVRRSVLASFGGLDSIADHLADDYMLGMLCSRAGQRIELSETVVEHHLGRPGIGEWLRRQARWNRGIRASRPGGYAGLWLTQGVTAAALLVAATEASGLAIGALAAVVAVRLLTAWRVGVRYLRDPSVRRCFWLIPLRDLAGSLLWASAYLGNTVEWRGRRYRLLRGGRLSPTGEQSLSGESWGPVVEEEEARGAPEAMAP